MKLFFTGLKHSGKTTFARLCAKELNLLWSDADDLLLEIINPLSVREFYKAERKEVFMEKEAEAVKKKTMETECCVISLGGGAADNKPLMEFIKQEGKIIYLTRPEDMLLGKILEKSGVPPFLDENDVKGSFHRLFERRDMIYREYADLIIDLGEYRDKEATLKEVLREIEKEMDNGWK